MSRSESLVPNFNHFKAYVSGPEYKQAIQGVTAEVSFQPTGFENADGDEQTLPVVVATPESLTTDKIILSNMAWSDELRRPENIELARTYAAALGAQVMIVGNPGVESIARDYEFSEGEKTSKAILERGMREGSLGPEQLEELKEKGRYRKIGAATVNAAVAANPSLPMRNKSDGIVFYASSQGAAVTAGAIGSTLDSEGAHLPLAGVVLAEGVNYRRWDTRFGLMKTFLTNGQQGAAEALASNPENIRNVNENQTVWLQRLVRSLKANKLYFQALARGRAEIDLGYSNLEGLQDVPVLLTRGSESQLSTEEANVSLVSHFGKYGVDADLHTYKGFAHPYTMATGATVETLRKVL